ncbi:transposase [Agrococcus sp. SGAir0287]|uniref:transposase n=1 Tax=Agrococcus sp. SGAir0287 TaxID=2070347 RepID=UPI0010CD2ADB|nr:transposase [Agrococcus sp. SGAir0287]QCR18649.1 transposase [Agrococcus sp. SGAir0287]
MVGLDEIARELLAAPPSDFVAARDARARAERDRDLARAIRALRRPTLAAWVVDALAREQPDAVARMLGLAESLRDAQDELDGAELRALTTQRRALVARLAADAVDRAEAAGVRVSAAAREDVERTLTAAMLDAEAGRAVASGRLVRALESVGLEGVDLAGALAGGDPPPAPVRASADELAGRRARKAAERAAREADAEASEAVRALRGIEAAEATARERAEHLDERIAQLQRDVARLGRERDAARAEERAAADERAAAERRVADAERRAAQSHDALD